MKTVVYFLLFIASSCSIYAKDCTLEVRAACYSPSSKSVHKTYSHAWIDYEVLASKNILPYWDVWGQVSWTIKKGHTSKGNYGFRDRTRAWILPVSAGLRFTYPVACRTNVYLGAGVSYSFLKIDNRCEDIYDYSFFSSSPFHKHIRKQNVGGLFKAGILINTGDNTFIDLFIDYFLQSFHLGHHDLFEEKVFGRHFKANGIKIGAGFGVNF